MNDFDNLMKAGAILRGHFLNDHIFIEKWMQMYIAVHFCRDKNKVIEFIDHFISQNVQFSKTSETFCSLLKRHHIDLFQKYQKELKYIDDINNERNVIGHFLLEAGTEEIIRYKEKGELVFAKFKHGADHIIYDKKQIQLFTEKVEAIKRMFKYIEPIEVI